MADQKPIIVLQWLAKADSDLATANILILGAEPHLDTGVYHCQQAIEKSLKAFLCHCDENFTKTHDLENLVSLCAKYDPEFYKFIDIAAEITPYATEFRYPGEQCEPERDDAEFAFKNASGIVEFITSKLKTA